MKSIIFVAMFVSMSGSTMAALLPWQAVTAQTQVAASAANDQGKTIFMGRCGTCHDADASKKLPDGSTLLGRLAKAKDPEARLGTRLKDPNQRRQVFLYLKPLIAAADHEK